MLSETCLGDEILVSILLQKFDLFFHAVLMNASVFSYGRSNKEFHSKVLFTPSSGSNSSGINADRRTEWKNK